MIALLSRIPLWVWLGLALSAAVGVQTLRLHHANTELSASRVALARAMQANQANMATIAKLQQANRQWSDKYAADMARGKAYSDAQVQYAVSLQTKLSHAQHTLQAVYEHHPEARAWADQRVPDAVTQQLRDNAHP